MKAHTKGWIAGAVWGVAELLRTHGSETEAKDMLRAVAHPKEILAHADPIDLEAIREHPWVAEVFESNEKSAATGSQGNDHE